MIRRSMVIVALLSALTGPALADAWIPLGPELGGQEKTTLQLKGNQVNVDLVMDVMGNPMYHRTLTINVLLPKKAKLIKAWWEAGRLAMKIKPTSDRAVTWPGDTDQIDRILWVLHAGETPYGTALASLFPEKKIEWRELTFVVPVFQSGTTRRLEDYNMGRLHVVASVPLTSAPYIFPNMFVGWPVPIQPGAWEYDIDLKGLVVDFAAVCDPETGRWRWVIPTGAFSAAPPKDNASEVIFSASGISADLVVGLHGAWALTESFTRNTVDYVPTFLVLSPVEQAQPKKQKSESQRTSENAGPNFVPIIPVIPVVPRRTRSA